MAWREEATLGKLLVQKQLTVQGGLVGANGLTGNVFYLDSNTGSDGGGCGTLSKPFATLDFALSKCTADKGDHIYAMPGHAQTISTAAMMTLDVAGVTLEGLGRYDARPTFTFTSTGQVLVTAANCCIKNCKLVAGVADTAVGMLITAKGFHLVNNMMEDNGALNWVDLIHVSADDYDADGLEIIGNEFITQDDATVTVIDLLKNIRDLKIIGNTFIGDFNAAPYAAIYQADGEIALNVLVSHNLFYNEHDDHAVCAISMVEDVSQGWILHNHCRTLDVAGHTPFLTGAVGLYCSRNFISYAGTDSGFEYPAIGTVA